jgi:hypothetical protein
MKKLFLKFIKMNIRVYVLLLLILLVGCSESKYSKLVKTEMAKNIVNDSLLFEMKFGQTRQEFYDQCWKLNSQKIIKQGSNNNFVQYYLPQKEGDSSINSIKMLFYGIFDKEKIMRGMDMRFSYNAWSLWNESTHSDKLITVVKDTLQSWYPGNGFIEVTMKRSKKDIFVKVDGNRRIIIEPLINTKDVDVRIDDLRYTID